MLHGIENMNGWSKSDVLQPRSELEVDQTKTDDIDQVGSNQFTNLLEDYKTTRDARKKKKTEEQLRRKEEFNK